MGLSRIAATILISAAVCHSQAVPQPKTEVRGGTGSAKDLVGLWEAKRVLGPAVQGTFLLSRHGSTWRGEVASKVAEAVPVNGGLVLELPGGLGTFRAVLGSDDSKIKGHWIQPETVVGGPYASPVLLTKQRPNEWSGTISSLENSMTFYLMVKPREDGSVAAYLRNPERNAGFMQYPSDRLEREGNLVRLLKTDKDGKTKAVVDGRYDPEADRLSLYFPTRGGTYDFRRLGKNEPSDFYPRGRPGLTYSYRSPPPRRDGWTTASLEHVAIDRQGIERFIQKLIDNPIDSQSAPEIHAVLVARHGKLVLEEYFHGEHREKSHDTRSAGKSLAADIAGAAIHAGYKLSASTPVYAAMNGGALPPGLDEWKRAMTLEHLLTMSSGLDCDEEDDASPGHEDNVKGPDIYRATLALKVVRQPGSKAVYCSVGANLAGGVVARAARQPSLALFQQLIADPLQIERYYMGVSGTHDYYLGGGARLLPRDFLKFAQVHVNGGTWNGRRLYSTEWSRRATSPLVKFSEESKAGYGYLWWTYDLAYRGRTVRAYFASGNGGQLSIGIDELGLAIVFYAGNYNDWETGLIALADYLPKHILPAVQEAPKGSQRSRVQGTNASRRNAE